MIYNHFSIRQCGAHPVHNPYNPRISIRCDEKAIIVLIIPIAANDSQVGIITSCQLMRFDLDDRIVELQTSRRDRSATLIVNRN